MHLLWQRKLRRIKIKKNLATHLNPCSITLSYFNHIFTTLSPLANSQRIITFSWVFQHVIHYNVPNYKSYFSVTFDKLFDSFQAL